MNIEDNIYTTASMLNHGGFSSTPGRFGSFYTKPFFSSTEPKKVQKQSCLPCARDKKLFSV